MSGQFRENWKRVTGQVPTSQTATDDGDITRVADGGGGAGGGSYTLVAKGIVGTDQDLGVIYTATVGKTYILSAWIPRDDLGNFQSGDENAVELLAIVNSSSSNGPRFLELTSVSSPSFRGSEVEFVKSKPTADILVSLGPKDSDGADSMVLNLLRNGDVTAKHTDVLNGTNGMYLIWEKS